MSAEGKSGMRTAEGLYSRQSEDKSIDKPGVTPKNLIFKRNSRDDNVVCHTLSRIEFPPQNPTSISISASTFGIGEGVSFQYFRQPYR